MRARPFSEGLAVPTVLLLVVALSLLATGTLTLASRELEIAATSVRVGRSRAAARGAALQGLATILADTVPQLAPGETTPIMNGSGHDVSFGATLTGLTSEWFLLEGSGRGASNGPAYSEGLLAWALDPFARVGSAPAVLTHGGALRRTGSTAVLGSRMSTPADGASAGQCKSLKAPVDSLFPLGRLGPSVRTRWDPDVADPPSIGLLGATELEGALSTWSEPLVTPRPVVVGGLCVPSPTNWGSPTDPAGPCGARRTAWYSTTGLTLAGGEAQGLLVVDGSVRLESGAVFAGLLVVRDTLWVEAGSRIVGLVRAGGPVVLSNSEVVGNACTAILALRAAPALRLLRTGKGGIGLRPF